MKNVRRLPIVLIVLITAIMLAFFGLWLIFEGRIAVGGMVILIALLIAFFAPLFAGAIKGKGRFRVPRIPKISRYAPDVSLEIVGHVFLFVFVYFLW